MFYRFMACLFRIIAHLVYRVRVTGLGNVPKSGALIVCANHNRYVDSVLLTGITKRQIHFMAKRELFSNFLNRWVFNHLGAIPVNRDGNDAASLKTALQFLAQGRILGVFPEGRRRRVGEDQPPPFKGGIAMLALRTKTPILPVHIVGNYKPFTVIEVRVGEVLDFSEYHSRKLTSAEYELIASTTIQESVFSL